MSTFQPIPRPQRSISEAELHREGLRFFPWSLKGNADIEITCVLSAARGDEAAYRKSNRFTLSLWSILCAQGAVDPSNPFAQAIDAGFRKCAADIESGEIVVVPLDPSRMAQRPTQDGPEPSEGAVQNTDPRKRGDTEYGSGDEDATANESDAERPVRTQPVSGQEVCDEVDCKANAMHRVVAGKDTIFLCEKHLGERVGS